MQSQQASNTIVRGGGSMRLAGRCSSGASSQLVSARCSAGGPLPGECRDTAGGWQAPGGIRSLMAHTARSRWLSRSRVAGSHRTAMGSRIGRTTCSRPLSSLLHFLHRPRSSVTWKCFSVLISCLAPCSSPARTMAGPSSTLNARSSHFGIMSHRPDCPLRSRARTPCPAVWPICSTANTRVLNTLA